MIIIASLMEIYITSGPKVKAHYEEGWGWWGGGAL
jgi:hypothetical protein